MKYIITAVMLLISPFALADWGSVNRFEQEQANVADQTLNALSFAPTQNSYLSFTGSGIKFSDNGPQFMFLHGNGEADDNFFHSDVGIEYSYTGISTSHQVREEARFVTTIGNLNANDYGNRRVLGLDYVTTDWSVSYLNANGNGIAGSYNLTENLAVKTRYLSNNHDVSQVGLALQYKSFGVEVERDSNPLYRDLDDNRVVFTWAKTFSGKKDRTARFSFVEQNALALDSIRAAGALSSGNAQFDAARRYRSLHGAAYDQLWVGVRRSANTKREHGGALNVNPDNSISAGPTHVGSSHSVAVPVNRTTAGVWHTHTRTGNKQLDRLNEQFSPTDRQQANQFGVVAFLGTPAWNIKAYVPPRVANQVKGLSAGTFRFRSCINGQVRNVPANLRTGHATNLRYFETNRCTAAAPPASTPPSGGGAGGSTGTGPGTGNNDR